MTGTVPERKTCIALVRCVGLRLLWSSATRVFTYSLPAIWLSTRPGFRMEHVWYLSIAATTLQAALSLWLLRREFRKRLVLPRQEGALVQAGPEPVAPPARAPA